MCNSRRLTARYPWLNMPVAKRRCYYDKTMVPFLSMIRGNFTTETQRKPRSETEIGLKLVYLRLGAPSLIFEEALFPWFGLIRVHWRLKIRFRTLLSVNSVSLCLCGEIFGRV